MVKDLVCSFEPYSRLTQYQRKRLGNFDPSITDSSFRLKKNYERYLLEYEYKLYPEHRQQALEFEKQVHSKRKDNDSNGAAGSNGNSPMPHNKKNANKKHKKRSKSDPNYVPSNHHSASPIMKEENGGTTVVEGVPALLKDKSGQPKLPLVLGEFTVENLGVVVPKAPYITEKHIWPVGFTRYDFPYFSFLTDFFF